MDLDADIIFGGKREAVGKTTVGDPVHDLLLVRTAYRIQRMTDARRNWITDMAGIFKAFDHKVAQLFGSGQIIIPIVLTNVQNMTCGDQDIIKIPGNFFRQRRLKPVSNFDLAAQKDAAAGFAAEICQTVFELQNTLHARYVGRRFFFF